MKRKNSSKGRFDNYSLNYRDVLKEPGYFGKNDEFLINLNFLYRKVGNNI